MRTAQCKERFRFRQARLAVIIRQFIGEGCVMVEAKQGYLKTWLSVESGLVSQPRRLKRAKRNLDAVLGSTEKRERQLPVALTGGRA